MTATKIEWATDSWNPIRARNREPDKLGWFCIHESDGCRFCYAETINHRLGTGIDFKAQNRDKVEIFLDERFLIEPMAWRRPRRIFVCSMSDLFGDWVTDEMLDRIFEVMGACEDQGLGHTFQILTKRADRQRDYMKSERAYVAWNKRRLGQEAWPPRNIWSGVSVEDQRRAAERIPALRDTPAAVRWLSLEPLLEQVDLPIDALRGISWCVVGGESGSGARPFNIEWARSILAQSKAAGVPAFMKQAGAYPYQGLVGESASRVETMPPSINRIRLRDRKGGDPMEWPSDLRVREYPAQERA